MIHYPTTNLVCQRLCPINILLPLHPFHLPMRLPYNLHIQPVLFPPQLGYPWPRYLLRLQTQVHNGLVCNELCDCVMTAGGISTRHHSLAEVASPSVCGPPCGRIRPTTSQCVGSSPTSMTHTTILTVPPSIISGPRSRHPNPLFPSP